MSHSYSDDLELMISELVDEEENQYKEDIAEVAKPEYTDFVVTPKRTLSNIKESLDSVFFNPKKVEKPKSIGMGWGRPPSSKVVTPNPSERSNHSAKSPYLFNYQEPTNNGDTFSNMFGGRGANR